MSYGSCIQRHLNSDLVAQIESTGKVQRRAEPKKSKHPPRARVSYRSYRGYAKLLRQQALKLKHRKAI